VISYSYSIVTTTALRFYAVTLTFDHLTLKSIAYRMSGDQTLYQIWAKSYVQSAAHRSNRRHRYVTLWPWILTLSPWTIIVQPRMSC